MTVDHGTTDRQALIAGTRTHEDKIRRAKATLGERYLCHPANRVKGTPWRSPESATVDVGSTFRRVRREMGLDLV